MTDGYKIIAALEKMTDEEIAKALKTSITKIKRDMRAKGIKIKKPKPRRGIGSY